MKFIDRFLQSWRISVAIKHIPADSLVLDVGCYDGLLFEKLGSKLSYGIGIDPLIKHEKHSNYELLTGYFPSDLREKKQFNAITMLAVLEHIPQDVIQSFAQACADALLPGGKLIITVPDAKVDHILAVLSFLRLIDGMSLEEHHGFDVRQTPSIFGSVGLKLMNHSSFQLGLNNLFVFQKPL